MTSATANYGWTKPDIGGSDDAWGGILNGTTDSIDAQVKIVEDAIPQASGSLPLASGTAAVGVSALFAREDHVHPSDTSRLPKSGGAMTGTITSNVVGGAWALIHSPASGNAAIGVNMTGGSGSNCLTGMVGGSFRWTINPGDGATETGSNAGSDFRITRAADNGVTIDTPFYITRATGNIAFTSNGPQNWIANSGGTLQGIYFYNSAQVIKGQVYCNVSTSTMNVVNTVASSSTSLDASGNLLFTPGAGGNAYKPGGGAWAATSDARIKTVVEEYSLGLAEISQLTPVVYKFKGNDTPTADITAPVWWDWSGQPYHGPAPYPSSPNYWAASNNVEYIGFLAQDVEGIFPGMVKKNPGFIDGQAVTDLRDLDTSELIYALVNAVKTLSARVAALEAGNG